MERIKGVKIFLLSSFFLVLLFGILSVGKVLAQSSTLPDDNTDQEIQSLIQAQQAQQTPTGTPESTSILMTEGPQNPAPGQDVSLTLSSYAEDLSNSTITWVVNGKTIASGIGKISITVQAPAAGGSMTVVANVTAAGITTKVTTVIQPNVMVLLWEATDSYVPPFYRGRAMPTPGTFIKVVALPEISTGGTFLNADTLTYNWQQNYNNQADASGYGQDYFVYKNDYLENGDDVEVTASDTTGTYVAQGSISVATSRPFLVFYREDAEEGILWNQILSNPYKINGKDTLVAAPYFISPEVLQNPTLTFNWSINNAPISVPNETKNIMPLETQGGTSGTASVELNIQNSQLFTEDLDSVLQVKF